MSGVVLGQTLPGGKDTVILKQANKPDIFTSGFIDVMNNGQVNASARFIRLLIGEPGKFAVPLSIYGGVSNNNFQNSSNTGGMQRSNDHLVNQYINPMSGLVNISIEGLAYLRNRGNATKIALLYQAGERILTGYKTGPASDPQTGNPVNFLNGFTTVGLYMQTAAWERSNAKNVGFFWGVIRFIGSYTNSRHLNDFLPTSQSNGIYHGYSIGFGVEINHLINLKVIYYKYTKQPELDYFTPIYQFSFNYSL